MVIGAMCWRRKVVSDVWVVVACIRLHEGGYWCTMLAEKGGFWRLCGRGLN